MKIGIVGLWHLGLTYTASQLTLGNEVTAFDPDALLIEKLKSSELPISEPGLFEILESALSTDKLNFVSNIEELGELDVIWICKDTEFEVDGKANVDDIEKLVKDVAKVAKNGCLIIVSSQVPVGTGRKLQDFLRSTYMEKNLSIACNPENLQLGNSLETFLSASRQVFGVTTSNDQNRILKIMRNYRQPISFTSVPNAELLKHALNTYIASTIVFANELAEIAQQTGANSFEVSKLMKSDPRVGSKAYLNPGPSIGGGTLLRDVNYLVALGNNINSNTTFLRSIEVSNSFQLKKIADLVSSQLDTGKSVGFAGITYKEFSSTLRGSQFIELLNLLTTPKSLFYCDPMADNNPLVSKYRLYSYTELLEKCDYIYLLRPNSEFMEVLEGFASSRKTKVFSYQGIHTVSINSDIEFIEFGVGENAE